MLANLKVEMYKRKITMEKIADFLGIHRNSVANKINGATEFSVEEAFSIRDKFFSGLGMDYLFKKDELPPNQKGA